MKRNVRRIRLSLGCNPLFVSLCLIVVCMAGRAGAQTGNSSSQSGTGYPLGTSSRALSSPSVNRTLGGEFPSVDPNFSHRQLVARREDLKKRMVENAARLLTLTHDLQTDLQSREATEADARRLDDIAKLARTIRDQMRQ